MTLRVQTCDMICHLVTTKEIFHGGSKGFSKG